MSYPSDEEEDIDPNGLPYVDHRFVAVTWRDGEEFPEVIFDASSVYEAIGFMQVGLDRLRHDYAIPKED